MLRIALALVFAALVGAACGGDNSPTEVAINAGLASCSPTVKPFTVAPQSPALIGGWVPLGNLNPPGHTFPTDHQYIYLKASNGGVPVELVAPGDMYVVGGKVTHYQTSAPYDDYAISFSPCQQILGEFGHVRTLTPALLQAIGPFNQNCNTYSPDGTLTVTQCYSRTVAVKMTAGETIGTSAGLDLSLFDNRVPSGTFANASRWEKNSTGFDRFHVVPFSDYYQEPARTTVASLLGAFDGRVRRTVAPIGGTIYTDIPGTAQGVWLKPGQPTFPETPHFTIAPNNVEPQLIDVSVGMSQAGLATGVYRMTPQTNGVVNVDPAQITVAKGTQCWDLEYYFGNGRPASLMLQLVDANTLKVEATSLSCTTLASRTFTSAAVTYVR
jgi:hypothetical protein